MTISECRKRRRIFKEMLFRLAPTSKFDIDDFPDEYKKYLELALARSIAVEDLNIKEIKEANK